MKAEYIFDRGKFGRWDIPMWAGETRALKLIRLLRKQGIKGILYEEGPLEKIEAAFHFAKKYQGMHLDPYRYRDYKEVAEIIRVNHFSAPEWFKVSFKVEQ